MIKNNIWKQIKEIKNLRHCFPKRSSMKTHKLTEIYFIVLSEIKKRKK